MSDAPYTTRAMDSGKVVELSLREFTDKLLPIPHELVSALFPESKMAAITDAFVEMTENYVRRTWYEPRRPREDQLALEFTQLINEHVLEYVAGKEVARLEESAANCAASDTHEAFGREAGGTSFVSTVPGYVMNVVPHQWVTNELGEVQRLDDEPPVEDDEDEDPDGVRTRSGAALFRRELLHELEPEQPNWPYQSGFVQFGQEGAHNDPFLFGALDESENNEMLEDDDNASDSRQRVLRQIRSCADKVSLYQHRTAVSSFVVTGRSFRAMHWDPSGVFVSERVDYVRDARALVGVLLAFIVADHEGQGYDATAAQLPKDSEDYELMDRVADENYWRLPVLPCAEGTPLPPTIPVQTYVTFDGAEFLVDDAGYFYDSPPGSPDDDGAATETAPKATTPRVLKDDAFIFQYVLDYFRDSLTSGYLRYKLTVGGDEFLVAAPLFFDERYGGARDYVALHKQSAKLVFLKDSWRPHGPSGAGAATEGEVLRKLNEDEVRNVPTLLCHGTVDGQVTRVLAHWMDLEDRRAEEERSAEDARKNAGGSASEDQPRGVKRKRDDLEEEEATPRVRRYVHCRIALEEVCLPLTAFTSSRQMVRIVGDAIDAHYDATEKSRIMHRDVSSEAIAILPTFVESEDGDGDGDDHTLRVVWRGMLSEWEFARPMPAHGANQPMVQPRIPDLWAARYMSASSFRVRSLSDPVHGIGIGIADELESFFNVLLHLAVRFCPHNLYHAPHFIFNNFLSSGTVYGENIHCPSSRQLMIARSGDHEFFSSSRLVFGRPEQPNKPLNDLLHFLLALLHARYKIFEYEHETALRRRVGLDSRQAPDDARTVAELYGPFDRDVEPARPSDAVYRRADTLKDHSAILDLFKGTKDGIWPEDDVVEDRLSFRAVLRDVEAMRRAGMLCGYRSPSASISRDVVVAARRALSRRRILG